MLTNAQRTDWDRDGFLVLPDFVSLDDCAALQGRANRFVADFTPDQVSVFSTTDETHAQENQFLSSGDKIRFFYEAGAIDAEGNLLVDPAIAFNKLAHAMHDLDPEFSRVSRLPQLATLAGDLGFIEPRLLQSMYIFKPPHIGGEVTWHTDHTFLWTEPQTVVGFWLAIDRATVNNGCMWTIPGSHRTPTKARFRRDGLGGTTTDILDTKPYPIEQKVPLEAEPGTLIALHGSLPHWSGPNTSAMPRHAYTLHVIDNQADYLDDNWLQRSADLPLRGF